MFSPVSAEPPDLADLSSHDAFVDGVPHRTFEHQRREDPVAWFDESGASGFWALTRHADIVAVNRNYRQFSSRRGIRMEEMADDERAARLTMMEQDPPEHTRLRRFVNRGFARPLIETYEQRVRDIAIRVLDRALARSEFDCVAAIAKALPLTMLADVLGVSEEDGAWLAEKGDEMIGNSDPDSTDRVDAPGSGMREGLPDMEAVFDVDRVRPGWEPGTGVVVADLEREGRPLGLCGSRRARCPRRHLPVPDHGPRGGRETRLPADVHAQATLRPGRERPARQLQPGRRRGRQRVRGSLAGVTLRWCRRWTFPLSREPQSRYAPVGAPPSRRLNHLLYEAPGSAGVPPAVGRRPTIVQAGGTPAASFPSPPSWAARARSSCSPTPTSTPPPARPRASTTMPGRCASAARGCWSRVRFATPSWRGCSRTPTSTCWATAGRPRPRSRRSSIPTTSLACTASWERAREAGDRVLRGGRVVKEGGLWYEPTLIDPCTSDSEIVQSEVFGPVLTLQTFEDEAQAVALANGTRYGLAGIVYTRDADRARRIGRAVRAGTVWVNCFLVRDPEGTLRRLRDQRHRARGRRLCAGLPQRSEDVADSGGIDRLSTHSLHGAT